MQKKFKATTVKKFFQQTYPMSREVIGKFITAIKLNDLYTVQTMLSEGLHFNDVSFFEGSFTALGISIQTGNFEMVKELVLRGALISDEDTQLWLKSHRTARHNPIIQLLALEKQKQINIMQAFCDAEGSELGDKLDNGREKIKQIQAVFSKNITSLSSKVSDMGMFQEHKPNVTTYSLPSCAIS